MSCLKHMWICPFNLNTPSKVPGQCHCAAGPVQAWWKCISGCFFERLVSWCSQCCGIPRLFTWFELEASKQMFKKPFTTFYSRLLWVILPVQCFHLTMCHWTRYVASPKYFYSGGARGLMIPYKTPACKKTCNKITAFQFGRDHDVFQVQNQPHILLLLRVYATWVSLRNKQPHSFSHILILDMSWKNARLKLTMLHPVVFQGSVLQRSGTVGSVLPFGGTTLGQLWQ